MVMMMMMENSYKTNAALFFVYRKKIPQFAYKMKFIDRKITCPPLSIWKREVGVVYPWPAFRYRFSSSSSSFVPLYFYHFFLFTSHNINQIWNVYALQLMQKSTYYSCPQPKLLIDVEWMIRISICSEMSINSNSIWINQTLRNSRLEYFDKLNQCNTKIG